MKDLEPINNQPVETKSNQFVTRRQALQTGGLLLASGLLIACGARSTESKPSTIATLAPIASPTNRGDSRVEATAVATGTATKVEASPQASPTVIVGGEQKLPTKVTVSVGDDVDFVFYASGVHENLPDGFFALNNVYEQQIKAGVTGPIVGPYEKLAFTPSRLDVISVSYAHPQFHLIKPTPITEKLRTRDGARHDFVGKMVMAEHSGQQIFFPEYAIGAETWRTSNSDNSTANGTPINKEYDWYAAVKDAWAITGEGSERFVEYLGPVRFDLSVGNTKAGPIAMWFKQYKFGAQ